MAIWGKTQYDVTMLQTTSKDALKRSALFVCGGDIKAATEIYDFFVKDMPNMPDYDSIQPSFMDKAKSTIGEVFGMIDENRDKIDGIIGLIQSFRGGGGGAPSTPTNLPNI